MVIIGNGGDGDCCDGSHGGYGDGDINRDGMVVMVMMQGLHDAWGGEGGEGEDHQGHELGSTG